MADQDQFQSFNAFYNNQEKGNDFMNQEPFDPEIVLPGELDHVDDEPETQALTPEEMALLKELQQQRTTKIKNHSIRKCRISRSPASLTIKM